MLSYLLIAAFWWIIALLGIRWTDSKWSWLDSDEEKAGAVICSMLASILWVAVIPVALLLAIMFGIYMFGLWVIRAL